MKNKKFEIELFSVCQILENREKRKLEKSKIFKLVNKYKYFLINLINIYKVINELNINESKITESLIKIKNNQIIK